MITAEKLNELISFTPKGLARVLDSSGYSMCSFETAKFVGITNGGQFCYRVTYYDEAGTGDHEVGKVFLSLDQTTGAVTADF